MKAHLLLFTVILSFTVSNATAQEDARKVKLDTRKTLRLDYKSDAWNRDPLKVETNILLVRDAGSGRIAKIEVTETGPNTSLFIGYYHIDFGSSEQGSPEITAEIYLAPAEMLAKPDGLKNIAAAIKDGSLLRKPYFLRIESGSIQAISVYDSRGQAVSAYEDFLKSGTGRPIVDRAALEAQKMAEAAENQRKALENQRKAEAEREKLENIEKQRQADLLKKQQQLDAAEKERRRARAKELAAEAMQFYKQEKYAEAEDRFEKATELDPENDAYFFQYGVTMYKREKYNKSLVLLDTAKGPGVNATEKKFFQAMNHMKLQEYDTSYREFLEVKSQNDKTLSPTSAFFAGVIDYQKENYDSAKGMFEYVLDHSDDPKLDQQSETYLEQISNIKLFLELQKKKFILNANMGMMYDSNILSLATNSALNASGVRAVYGGSIEYRPIYTPKHEFSGLLAVSDMYSVDTAFAPVPQLQNSDPLLASLKFPYRYKDVFFGKGGQLSLTPYVETTLMNADTVGTREAITNSMALAMDQTLVMSESWFSNYTLEGRRDISLLGVTGAEAQTGNKVMLYTTQTFFLDPKKSSGTGFELGYTMFKAEGDNQSYNKMDVAGNYFAPVWKDVIWSARLSYYNSNYATHSSGRVDTNYGLSLGLRTALSETLALSTSAAYNANQSTLAANTYNKWSIATNLAWNQSF